MTACDLIVHLGGRGVPPVERGSSWLRKCFWKEWQLFVLKGGGLADERVFLVGRGSR